MKSYINDQYYNFLIETLQVLLLILFTLGVNISGGIVK